MRLSGSPSETIQSIRQPSNTINKDSLVFVYPIVMDKALMKYATDIRDFLTVQFITQIKTSNTLDIQVAASRSGYVEVNNDYINPADELAKNLGILGRDPSSLQTYLTQLSTSEKRKLGQGYNQSSPYEYQAKIDKMKQFIADQIKYNPQYKDLNPILSTVTIENLIDVPLVIGTKKYFVSSPALFWMLFISAGYNSQSQTNSLSLTSSNNLNSIKRIMAKVTPQDYMTYFGTTENPNIKDAREEARKYDDKGAPSGPSHRVHQLLQGTETEMDQMFKYFSRLLNANEWADEAGIKTSDSIVVNASAAVNDTIVLRDSVVTKSKTLFNGFMANEATPLFNSIANALVSSDDIDVSDSIRTKSDQIISQVDSFFDLMASAVQSGAQKEGEDQSLQTKLDMNSVICDYVPKIAVEPILRDLKSSYFGLVGMDTNKFAKFVDNLVKLSTQLTVYTTTLESYISRLATDEARLKAEFEKGKSAIRELIFNNNLEKTPAAGARINLKEFGLFNIFITKTPARPATAAAPAVPERFSFGTRIRTLLGGRDVNPKLLDNLASAIAHIIYFLSLYCFLAYICEYFKSVVENIKIQKRDALEFPNYCLVLKSTVVEKLYMSLAALGFRQQKAVYDAVKSSAGKDEADQIKERNVLQQFKLNEKHMANMIRLINERLQVPNLIVIDEKSGTVYYKFMFNTPGQTGQISFSNMKSFVDHQKDIFQVF